MVLPVSQANESIAAEVRAALARARVTQRAVARALKCSDATASRKTNGRSPFTAEELVTVARLAGVDAAEFFADHLGASRATESSAYTDVA